MHQAPSPHQQGSQDSPFADIDWRGILASVILIILVIAIGPLTLALTWGIRAWCVRSRLDAADRWDSMRVFAWLFGMLTILAILAFFFFPVQALHVWTISPFSHLGAPDLLHNFWLRWTLSLPLACALAFVLEEGDPRTIHQFSRFQTATERKETDRRRAEQQAAHKQAEERERAARLAKLTSSVKKPAMPRTTRTPSASPPATHTPHPADAPGQTTTPESGKPTLWDELPADHPWKQVAQHPQDPQPQQHTPPNQAAKPPAEPPPPVKKEKPKLPDLGDGSMDALL